MCTFVCRRPGWGLLLDTWGKDGLTLLDWMSRVEIDRICRVCRNAGVTIALAGSLGRGLIRTLKPTAPDWFAVRGAACDGSHRTSVVDANRVRDLVESGSRPPLPQVDGPHLQGLRRVGSSARTIHRRSRVPPPLPNPCLAEWSRT